MSEPIDSIEEQKSSNNSQFIKPNAVENYDNFGSYTETDNPEVEAAVQYYERKIGIFENTLDLFKENLIRVNNQFNSLRLVYRPLKQSHESLILEHEKLTETNYINQLEAKKKNSALELSRTRVVELEKQVQNYEKGFEKFKSIFNYLDLDVTDIISKMKSNEKKPKWKLICIDELQSMNRDSTTSVDDIQYNLIEGNMYNDKSHTEDNKLSSTTTKNQILDIEILDNMNLSFDVVDLKKSSSSLSSSPVNCTLEKSPTKMPNLDEFDPKINNNSITVDSPNIKICRNDDDLLKHQFENGNYVFIPDNDYFRIRSYVCSKNFAWDSNDDIYVTLTTSTTTTTTTTNVLTNSLYDSFVKNKTISSDSDKKIHRSKKPVPINISFDPIVYDSYKNIPKTQPIDGYYLILTDDNESSKSVQQSKKFTKLSYNDIMEVKNEDIAYKFVPTLQYQYLSGELAIPKFFQNLILPEISKISYLEKGDDIWPFRRVYYDNIKMIPKQQPIKGFYIFIRNKCFMDNSSKKSRNASCNNLLISRIKSTRYTSRPQTLYENVPNDITGQFTNNKSYKRRSGKFNIHDTLHEDIPLSSESTNISDLDEPSNHGKSSPLKRNMCKFYKNPQFQSSTICNLSSAKTNKKPRRTFNRFHSIMQSDFSVNYTSDKNEP